MSLWSLVLIVSLLLRGRRPGCGLRREAGCGEGMACAVPAGEIALRDGDLFVAIAWNAASPSRAWQPHELIPDPQQDSLVRGGSRAACRAGKAALRMDG